MKDSFFSIDFKEQSKYSNLENVKYFTFEIKV